MVPDIEKKDREVKELLIAQHKHFLVEVWITNKVKTEKIKKKKTLRNGMRGTYQEAVKFIQCFEN